MSSRNQSLYKKIIREYENNTLTKKGSSLLINGKEATTYTFKKDYFWMMGDNRHRSCKDCEDWEINKCVQCGWRNSSMGVVLLHLEVDASNLPISILFYHEIDFDLKNHKTIDVQTIFHKMEQRTLLRNTVLATISSPCLSYVFVFLCLLARCLRKIINCLIDIWFLRN